MATRESNRSCWDIHRYRTSPGKLVHLTSDSLQHLLKSRHCVHIVVHLLLM